MVRSLVKKIIYIYFLLSLPATGLGFTLGKETDQEEVPVHIVSDEMVADQKEGKISFSGNVVTRRGDMIINSDKLEILNRERGKSVIIASGHVKMNQGNRAAEAEIAEFYEAEQKVILKGNPVIQEEGRIIKGSEMTFYTNEDKSLVIGNKKNRVNVTLYPSKDQK
jgi:lipopolysaccharide transport protein LptA